jgi:mono/diheme cytochrome c family protein
MRVTAARLAAGLLGLGLATAAVLSAQPAQTTADRVYSEAQAGRGKAVYEKECANCHMADLRGEGFAPPLVDAPFAQRWRNGKLGDLLTIVNATMPADRPNTLTPAQYAEVVAYLLKMNGYPAGEQPLSEKPADLAQVVFTKPSRDSCLPRSPL